MPRPDRLRFPRFLILLTALGLLAAACTSRPPSRHPPTGRPSGVTATATAASPSAAPPPSPSPSPSPAPVHTTAAPSRTTPPAPPAQPPAHLPNFSHIAVIVMENEEYSSVIGASDAPYINSLANQGALATSYYAISHPSLPNYLALTGGSTFGVSSDCSPGSDCKGSGQSIADQLQAAGISWKAYMEDLPACPAQSDAGNYAVRHNPFAYYPQDVAYCGSKVVPASQLSGDIASGNLPRFAWITPNLCDDMHDPCGGDAIAHGDSYLRGVVPQLLAALGPDGVVFITFDEGDSDRGGGLPGSAGGQVVTIAAGSAVRAGAKSSDAYDHYSLLATIEAAWGLPRLNGAASAPLMADLFH
ncbi:MAG TPA: alkaline phosphatase family protein [Actinomycetota bacterium]|nr:alkaline phosphatase family protein [Actinomycetota bacterium]